jgi:type I restriction enzyme, S subunit
MSKFLTIGDVCKITTGSLDSNAFVENGKYPFYTCAKEPTKINSYAFDDDVVLVAGNNAQGNFHVNRFKGKFNAYQRTYILTTKGEKSIDYIYYLLSLALKLLKDKSQGSQTKFLTIGILKDIHVPNLANSQIIAKVLSDLDAKIELNNRINRELEAMAKTLYDYWFVQFDFPVASTSSATENSTLSGVEGYKSSGGKMVYNADLKREIPEGWEVKTLLDIATYVNGFACQNYRPTNEEFLPVIKIREMRDGITVNTERVKADIPDKLIVNDGDVLFSWSASLEVMIWSGGKGGLNQHIFKVTSKKYPRSFYYYQLIWYLQHFKMIAELRKTTMGHITQDHLKQSRIVIPPIEIVKALDEKLYPIQEKQILLQKQNQQLSELRDWLLPMLMNGQVVSTGSTTKLPVPELVEGMAAEPGVEYKKG